MDEGTKLLRREAERVTAPIDPLPRIKQRLGRRRRQRRTMATVTALVVAGAGFLVVYAAFGDRQPRPVSEPGGVARVTARIDLEGQPRDVAAGEGLVWVISNLLVHPDGEPVQVPPGTDVVELEEAFHDAILQAVDPASNEVILRSSLREQLGRSVSPWFITVGEGSVWVSESGGRWIHKIDPATGEVVGSFEPIRDPSVLQAAAGALWYVAEGDPRVDREPAWEGLLVKVDPQTLETVATVPIGDCCAADLVEAGGSLWLGHQVVRDHQFTLEVLRIDPGVTRVMDRVLLDRGAWTPGDTLLGYMAASPGSVWVPRPESGFVDRIDAATGDLADRLAIDAFPLPDGAAWHGGYVWVGSLRQGGALVRIDPVTNEARAESLDVPTFGGERRAGTERALWIADDTSLLRIEAAVGGADAGSTPDVVRVVCGDQTKLLNSSVVRQGDGVHFELSNPAGAGALFVRDPKDPQDSWMRGALADVGSAEFTLPVPHGEVLVACLRPPVNTLELSEQEFEQLTVMPR